MNLKLKLDLSHSTRFVKFYLFHLIKKHTLTEFNNYERVEIAISRQPILNEVQNFLIDSKFFYKLLARYLHKCAIQKDISCRNADEIFISSSLVTLKFCAYNKVKSLASLKCANNPKLFHLPSFFLKFVMKQTINSRQEKQRNKW